MKRANLPKVVRGYPRMGNHSPIVTRSNLHINQVIVEYPRPHFAGAMGQNV